MALRNGAKSSRSGWTIAVTNSPTLPLVGSGTIIIKDGPAGGERVLKFNGNPPQVIIQGKDLPGTSSRAQEAQNLRVTERRK